MFTQNHGLCPWDKKAAPISSPAAEESLPLMREVAFAEQMTEGEKGLKRLLSPQSRAFRSTAPSSEGADKKHHRQLKLAEGQVCNRNRIRET